MRSFMGGDEVGILSVWNASLAFDPINMDVFITKVLCDPNFDPEGLIVAEAQGSVVGFCLAIVRKVPMKGTDLELETGWITAFGVLPTWRGKGVGAGLLGGAEAFLKSKGRSVALVSPYAPNYFWPGVDHGAYPNAVRLLESLGYRTLYSPVAMDKNLVDFTVPEDVREVERARVAEGYRFATLDPSRVYELITFADERFNPDWGRAVREAITAKVPREQMFIAVDPQGRIVGFSLFGCYGGAQDRFGPFGVDDGQRGKGLGKVLLYRTLEAMKAAGLHGAWFLWTAEGSPAGHLYARAGFTVTRRFQVMRKGL